VRPFHVAAWIEDFPDLCWANPSTRMSCSQFVAEIIHVFEPFVRLEAKVRESDLVGIIGEADAALVSDTILLSVNDKLVQMEFAQPMTTCTVW
jgi:hypothetical protein